MLLRFRLKNFRSFKDEQEISLVSIKQRTKESDESLLPTKIDGVKALRCVAIYGSNASGKTNLLKGMDCFAHMVADSQRLWKPTAEIPTWNPFELDQTSKSGETEFQIDFETESGVYKYGFKFNAHHILEEFLLENTGKAKTLFRRTWDGSTVSVSFPSRNLIADSEDSKRLEAIKLQVRPNSLFLSAAAQGNHALLTPIYDWISSNLRLVKTSSSIPVLTQNDALKPGRTTQIKSLLKFADIGIEDFEIKEEEDNEKLKAFQTSMLRAFQDFVPEITIDETKFSTTHTSIRLLHHGENGAVFPLAFEQESAGTQAYLNMLGSLLNSLESGSCLLIDEMESSLHPNLGKFLVQIFNDSQMNPMGSQLIFNTHDTNLLDSNLFRRDQIWLTEKKSTGETLLIPLSDFRPRKDQNLEAAYLHGRFGAVPFLDEDLLRSSFTSLVEVETGLAEETA